MAMEEVHLKGKEVADFSMDEIDDILSKLSMEEIEELNSDFDPDVRIHWFDYRLQWSLTYPDPTCLDYSLIWTYVYIESVSLFRIFSYPDDPHGNGGGRISEGLLYFTDYEKCPCPFYWVGTCSSRLKLNNELQSQYLTE